jgi:hypothetical protein
MIDYKEVSVVSIEQGMQFLWKATLLIDNNLWIYEVCGENDPHHRYSALENTPFGNRYEHQLFRVKTTIRLNYRNPKETLDKFFKLLVIS